MSILTHISADAAGLATLPVLVALSGPAEKVWERRPVVVKKLDRGTRLGPAVLEGGLSW